MICLSEKDFKSHISRMKEWFLAGDYTKIVVNDQIEKSFLVKINLLGKPLKMTFSL